MIPTSSLDPGAIITNDQRIYSIQKFIEINPFYELQDLYQWLYFGEFGSVMEKTDKPSAKTKPELIKILEQLKIEKEVQSDDVVWESMGLSFRFVMVYLTPYSNLQCPITRIINLLDRSPAFRGTRVHFKLDWVFVKEYIIKHSNKFTKFDFYGFEDRYNFHQLPTIPFTESYFKAKPKSFRILPRKLFFEFFPEFDTREDVLYTRPKDSLID
jgi:hypothetical protein